MVRVQRDAVLKRFDGLGLGLQELAVLAATLEHLVHKEAIERLKVAYEANSFSIADVLNDTEETSRSEMYMVDGRNAIDYEYSGGKKATVRVVQQYKHMGTLLYERPGFRDELAVRGACARGAIGQCLFPVQVLFCPSCH